MTHYLPAYHPAMNQRFHSSRRRFRQYKSDLKRHRHDGEASRAPQALTSYKPSRRRRSFLKLFGAFWGMLKGHRGGIYYALTTVTIATLLNLLPPYATKIVIDYVLAGRPLPAEWTQRLPILPSDRYELLAFVAVCILAISMVSIVIGTLGRWQATKSAVHIKPQLRRRVFHHAMRLPLHRVYEIKAGGTASILREDTGAIGDLIFSLLYNPWKAVIQLLGSLVILSFIDWRLLLGSMVLLPTVWMTHKTWISRIRPLYRDMHATRQQIDSQTTEAFGGVRVVRSFGRHKTEASRFIRTDQFRARQEVHAWWWARSVDIAWSILIPLASAALLWYGGSRVLDGALTIGDLVLFLTYLIMLLEPIATLASSATQFQSSLAGLDRVLDLLSEPAEMPDRPGAVTIVPEQVAGRITLRDVSFSYPGSTVQVLRNISLDVRPDELIALVGPSGAGKTTLCNLIARFYDPVEGVIELDGRDARDIRLESYRRLLGIVEQDIFLFDGTVAENIGYGRRNSGMTEIEHFARLANAHEFIMSFDLGYDTVIGERGVKLSGGQRQRLAIARALLANPRILILDEATSNLDTESERLIQRSILTLMRGRTSFVIAHRLSTIAHADRIIVLENGSIVEQGTHDELMARSGKYRRMVQLQTEPVHAPMVDAPGLKTRSAAAQ